MVSKNLKKSIVIGLTVLVLDFLAHTYIANKEVFGYFLAKPFISAYVAYYMYEYKYNIFKFMRNTIPFYLYYSVLFAGIHGAYYRFLDFATGKPFFDRVGDIHIGNFVFEKTNILMSSLGWLGIHGFSFFIGIILAKELERRNLLWKK